MRRLICGFVALDVATLKMEALCGKGGAGRDGDIVLVDGGWWGLEGLLTAPLTDLELRVEIIYTGDYI